MQINALSRHGYTVTVVMFGQHELIQRATELQQQGRTDLHARFFQDLYEFEGVMKAVDLEVIFHACDEGSEFPDGKGWSYTQFLWPQAFAHGFRLASQSEYVWDAFMTASPNTHLRRGLSMNWVARLLAEFAQATRDNDLPIFDPTSKMWSLALRAIGYCDNHRPLRRAKRGGRRATLG